MGILFSRRRFLGAASAAAVIPRAGQIVEAFRSDKVLPEKEQASANKAAGRIVDVHVHFDAKKPNYIDDFLKVSDRLNLTACLLTPFANRKLVAEAAKQHPTQIIPFGFVDLDAPDVVKQVEELHAMGYRGLGELEFVKKPYNDPSYFPVYELANRYGWIVLFHTGIVLRRKFDEPEDVASGRMRPIFLEEIARRFPKITVLGAHCGNPEYEWAAEIARWNPNVFWDLSGSTQVPKYVRIPARNFRDRKSTRLNSSHDQISYAVFCLKKKTNTPATPSPLGARSRCGVGHKPPPLHTRAVSIAQWAPWPHIGAALASTSLSPTSNYATQ